MLVVLQDFEFRLFRCCFVASSRTLDSIMAAATGGAKAVPFVQVWESRSALTDDQHELVAAIGKFAAVPALPAHVRLRSRSRSHSRSRSRLTTPCGPGPSRSPVGWRRGQWWRSGTAACSRQGHRCTGGARHREHAAVLHVVSVARGRGQSARVRSILVRVALVCRAGMQCSTAVRLIEFHLSIHGEWLRAVVCICGRSPSTPASASAYCRRSTRASRRSRCSRSNTSPCSPRPASCTKRAKSSLRSRFVRLARVGPTQSAGSHNLRAHVCVSLSLATIGCLLGLDHREARELQRVRPSGCQAQLADAVDPGPVVRRPLEASRRVYRLRGCTRAYTVVLQQQRHQTLTGKLLTPQSTYKEASTYYTKLRFQQGRALTMVKNYIVSALRTATNQIVQQNQAGKLDPSQGTEQSKAYLKYVRLAVECRARCLTRHGLWRQIPHARFQAAASVPGTREQGQCLERLRDAAIGLPLLLRTAAQAADLSVGLAAHLLADALARPAQHGAIRLFVPVAHLLDRGAVVRELLCTVACCRSVRTISRVTCHHDRAHTITTTTSRVQRLTRGLCVRDVRRISTAVHSNHRH